MRLLWHAYLNSITKFTLYYYYFLFRFLIFLSFSFSFLSFLFFPFFPRIRFRPFLSFYFLFCFHSFPHCLIDLIYIFHLVASSSIGHSLQSKPLSLLQKPFSLPFSTKSTPLRFSRNQNVHLCLLIVVLENLGASFNYLQIVRV